MTTPLSATAHGGVPTRGVVHAGGIATRYLRAGRGEAVVLVAGHLEDAGVMRVVDALSNHFLVFAAAPGLSEAVSLSRWCREFLECLGVDDAQLMVHASASTILFSGDNTNA